MWCLPDKLSKFEMPEFFMIFVRKINKIAKLYVIFDWKMPEFYMTIARRKKIFFSEFWGTSPAPVSYAFAINFGERHFSRKYMHEQEIGLL